MFDGRRKSGAVGGGGGSGGGAFEEALAPFGAGEFAPVVGGQAVHKPPGAGDLPGGELGEEELPEGFGGGGAAQDDAGDDGVGAGVVRGGGAEDEAFNDGGVLGKRAFDGLGGEFSAGEVDLVGEASAEEDLLIAEFDEVVS